MVINQLKKREIKELGLNCGATDVGIISIDMISAEQREIIMKVFPKTKSLISIAVKYNPNAIRSYYRSISNSEYHHTFKKINRVTHDLDNALIERGIEAVSSVLDFPMETDLDTPASWLVSHRNVAVKAGIGRMGLNRLVIHKDYGPYILLNTILINHELVEYDDEMDENPCINCNLCQTVCPTGSISKEGFNFMGCYTHNYRDMRNGFLDLSMRLEKGNKQLDRLNAAERSAIWQSMQFGSNYRCSYCVAVCPAASNEIGKFKDDRKSHFENYVKPFQEKEETIYVMKGTDSDYYVDKLEGKKKKYVSNGLEISSIKYFKNALRIAFQKNQAKEISRVYHFIFSGEENNEFTVKIDNGKLSILDGLMGKADFRLNCDSNLWLKFLSSGRGMVTGVISGKIKTKGNIKLLKEFSKYFPT